nr:RagB/SusD family nutrient uptake outer membrane protein [uncultured Psychroserpens sp.]
MKTLLFYRETKYSFFLVLISLFTLSSCEDFLEEQPTTEIDANYIYSSEAGLKSGIVGLYSLERERYETGTEDYMGSVLMSSRSDLAFSRTGYTGLMGRYERGVSPIDQGTNFTSSLFWDHYYSIATKATEIINAAEVLDDIEEESRNQIIAEAKFFRAHSYFYLYRMYNNIYVTTQSLESAFDVINDKSSEEEIFTLLNDDLTFAIANLEWTDTFGRITKGTAKHVKAKVAMWQGDWIEAKNQALGVIEGPDSPHSLVSSTADVFAGDRNNSESLFVIQRNNELAGGGGLNMMNANYVTQYFQISGIESNNEQGGRGFSRILPNRYLMGLIAEDPNDTRDDDTYFRLKWYYTSGSNFGEEVDNYAPFPSTDYQNYYKRMHPSCIKFAQEDGNQDSYLITGNILVYRLAETYLIAAEAIMNSTGNPLPYINAIRTRANAAPLASVSQQDILDERARELAFEGQRWFTLKRMGQAVIDFQMTNYAGDGEFFPANLGSKDPRENWMPHFINWPIAQRDLDLLGAGYPQNDGY